MASYLSNYDANSYVTHGYDLPVQQIMGALSAKTQYYLSSAQKIKNDYDASFHKLSNDSNIQAQNQMREKADQQLKGIVKNDLSIGDYTSQAHNVFKPIATNTDFIADEQLTTKIENGFNQAKADLKKNGAKYYNPLSLEVMNNTLQKWKSDDPKNIDTYLGDQLGTTYQPYDPTITEKWQKDLKEMTKPYKTEQPTTIGGIPYIVTKEGSKLSGLEATEYIRSTIPQQEQTQISLQSRLVATNNQKRIAENPANAPAIMAQFSQLKTNAIASRQNYVNSEIKNLEFQKALTPADDKEKHAQIDTAIKNYTTYRDKIPDAFSSFDDKAYIDPHNQQQAQAQIESLLLDKHVNGLIGGLGLDNSSLTYKQDAAAISMLNLRANQQKQLDANKWKQMEYDQKNLEILTKAGTKLKKDATGKLVIDPEVQATTGVTPDNIVADTQLKDEWATTKQVELAGKTNLARIAAVKEILKSYKAELPDGKGNFSDIYTMMEGMDDRSSFGDLMGKFDGRDDETKKNLIALTTTAAGKDASKLTVREAKDALFHLFTDKDKYEQVTAKVGSDSKTFDVASRIATNMELLNSEDKNNMALYAPEYVKAAREAHWDISGVKSSRIFNLNSDDYIESRRAMMKKDGYSDKDIEDTKQYLKGENINNPRLLTRNMNDLSMVKQFPGSQGVTYGPGNTLVKLKQNWDNYKSALTRNLAEHAGSSFNVNSKNYNIWSEQKEGSKSFDAEKDIENDEAAQIILPNLDSAIPQDAATANGLKKYINTYGRLDAKLFSGFKVYSGIDGGKPFVKLFTTPDEKAWGAIPGKPQDKLFGDSWKDISQKIGDLKIYISTEQAEKLMGKMPQGFQQLQSGYNHDIALASKGSSGPNKLNIFQGSSGITIKAQPLVPVMLPNGQFKLEQENINADSDEALGPLGTTGLSMDAIRVNPVQAIQHIRYIDKASVAIAEKLKNIKPDQNGYFNFATLPDNTKKYLLSTFPSFFQNYK